MTKHLIKFVLASSGKRVVLVSALLLLTSCANNGWQQQACLGIAQNLGNKDQAWVSQCAINENTYRDGLFELARTTTPEDLCEAKQDYIDPYYSSIFNAVVAERKIDCEPYRIARIKDAVKSLSLMDLCALWGNGQLEAVATKFVREEVKQQDIDCPALLAASAQQQQAVAQQQQAIAQYQQAIAQQRQAAAQQRQAQSSSQNAYQRPMKTSCQHVFGGAVECTSRPTGPDLSVFGRVRTMSDY